MDQAQNEGAKSPFEGLDSSTLPYWESAREGRLLIQRCNSCGESYFYPRPFCPLCSSEDVAWRTCSGEGAIYTFTRLAKARPMPAVIAYVTLAEGPTLLTRIEDAGNRDIEIGMPVEAHFAEGSGGMPLLLFRPRD